MISGDGRQILAPVTRVELEHPFPFDPTCGQALEELLRIRPPAGPPQDFEEFWRGTYRAARAMEAELEAEFKPLNRTAQGLEVHQVSYRSWGGQRIGGWLVEPAAGVPVRALAVVGHGYGGRGAPEYRWARAGVAALYVCARGFNLSAHPALPGVSSTHVLHGLEHRDSYILRGCVAELWHAGTILSQRHPAAAGRLIYLGESFGGGLGALMLPWDARFKRALLRVPTFGHHPLRLGHPCTGSGESVRRLWLQRPEIESVLRYYDAATAASFVRIPVLCEVALFDPAVIPPGQFAVANALSSPGSRLQVTPFAHFAPAHPVLPPAELQRLDQEWVRFVEAACGDPAA